MTIDDLAGEISERISAEGKFEEAQVPTAKQVKAVLKEFAIELRDSGSVGEILTILAKLMKVKE